MFKDFYRTTFSFLRPLLLLLGLLLPFSLCIADGYISISPTWDEYTQKYKTYYFEKWGKSFIELGSLIKKGLAPENKKVGLKNSCKNPWNLAMKKPWKLCSL
ncbi:hypothetical protein HpKG121_13590 [Helicobacter pylori]